MHADTSKRGLGKFHFFGFHESGEIVEHHGESPCILTTRSDLAAPSGPRSRPAPTLCTHLTSRVMVLNVQSIRTARSDLASPSGPTQPAAALLDVSEALAHVSGNLRREAEKLIARGASAAKGARKA